IDGERLPAAAIATVHKDRPIWVRYDLAAVGKALTKQTLRTRHETLWRYRELLPYFDDADVVSLGERMSPLLPCPRLGARCGLSDGCGRMVREGKERLGWFDLSTLKEPYRLEGKKTMGLELAEQFDWRLPDVILYPTGGGTGLVGMWKAFAELKALGWLESD